MNENKYEYFLDQCNGTPFSKDWIEVFGPIDEGTIKQFGYEVKNPNDFREAIKFAKILDEYLGTPPHYDDWVYKHFHKLGEIPKVIQDAIEEVLEDPNFQLLIKKERGRLGVPVEKGRRPLLDPEIHGEAAPTSDEAKAVDRLMTYTALTGERWKMFFKYLLLYNYVIPITYLDIRIDDLGELVGSKKLLAAFKRFLGRLEPIPLRKRQINLADELVDYFEEAADKTLPHNTPPTYESRERKIKRRSRRTLRKLLGESYPKGKISKTSEAIKVRRKRAAKRILETFKEIEKKASSIHGLTFKPPEKL